MEDITKTCRQRPAIQAISTACAAMLVAPSLWATTYTVNNPNDSQVAGQISLREAIAAANTNAASGNAPAGEATGDVINVTVPVSITQGELTITDDVTINLSGAVTVTNNDSRAFSIAAGATEPVNISGGSVTGGGMVTDGGAIQIAADSVVTIDGTSFTGNSSTGAARFEGGGAIWNAGTLTLTNADFSNNTVTGDQGNGGGLLNIGTATVNGGTFTGNMANRAGGGIENDVMDDSAGTIVLNQVTLDGNTVGTAPGNGGGLHQGTGSVTVNGGTITNNTAGNEGGGLWAGGTSNITGTAITDNVANGTNADNGGGGLFNNGGGMTVTNATITGNQAVQAAASGGGVFNKANGMTNTLSMTGSTVSNNTTNRAGGGVEDNGGIVNLTNMTMSGNRALGNPNVMGAPGNGGAVHSSGSATVTINRGTYSNNTAAAEGGGIWTAGTATISNVLVQDNSAAGDAANQGGGGLFNMGGDMTVEDSQILRNIASGAAGSGGGILSDGGTLSVEDSVISSNQANRAGGGIEISAAEGDLNELDEVLMENNNAGVAPATAAPGNGGAVHLSGNSSMVIEGSRFSGNMAALEGGALWNSTASMSVLASSITNNTSEGGAAGDDGGGGIFNNGGTLDVQSSDISNNIANGAAGSGGGILNVTNGVVTVVNSTINNNSASRAGGALEDNGGNTDVTLIAVSMVNNQTGSNPGNGGAVHITGAGSVTVQQSEVSGNTASNEGGGLWNFSTGTLTVVNSTVSGNSAPNGAGLFQDGDGSDFAVTDSTIANNSGTAIEVETGGSMGLTNSIVTGAILGTVAGNNNVVEVTSPTISGTANVQGQSAQLAGLADNGGPTKTHAIAAGPAIDSAETTDCGTAPRDTDQRGFFTRPFDGDATGGANCDAGAFEFTDAPEVNAAATTGTTGTAAAGDTNVSGVGFTVVNPSTNGSIEIDGFQGRLIAGRNTLAKLLGANIILDANNNGVVDSGDTDITAQTTSSFTPTGGFFQVDFTPNRTLASGASESYLITVNFSAAAMAGFGLLVLPLLWLLAFKRQFRAAVLVATGLLGLAACSSSSPTVATGGGAAADSADTLQFVVTQVRATSNGGASGAIVRSLPVSGPVITVQ